MAVGYGAVYFECLDGGLVVAEYTTVSAEQPADGPLYLIKVDLASYMAVK